MCVCVCVCIIYSNEWISKVIKSVKYNKEHRATSRVAAAAAKSLQLCLTLCDPTDGSPAGSSVPGILQARTLEWVAISFSNARKWKVKVKSFSRVWLSVTLWTAAYQAPPSMGFSRQEYCSGVPVPSPTGRAPQWKQFHENWELGRLQLNTDQWKEKEAKRLGSM